jgi:hypothetical protein
VSVGLTDVGYRDGVDLEPPQFVLLCLAQLTELARNQRKQRLVELVLVQGPMCATDRLGARIVTAANTRS